MVMNAVLDTRRSAMSPLCESPSAQWEEVWEGEPYMPPMPTYKHQSFEFQLAVWLFQNWAIPNGNLVQPQMNLTTLENEADWRSNFRIPDIVLLTPDRFGIIKGACLAGPPLVCIEIRSPNDATDEKRDFYGPLGVPEFWIFDSETRKPEILSLEGGSYQHLEADAKGWTFSPLTGIEFRRTEENTLRIRLRSDPRTQADIPNV